MNNAIVPYEPPYMDRCREIDFAPLQRYIHDSLEKLSKPLSPNNEESPQTQEEFVVLCDLLNEKAKALKENTPTPRRPTYHGPSDPGHIFWPSDKLDKLYREQREAERRIEYEHKHGDSKVYLEYLQDELDKIKQKITPVEEQEKQEYNERRREYEEAYAPYRERLQAWQAELTQTGKRREAEIRRDEIVQRTYRKVKRTFSPKRLSGPRHISILPWELGASGEEIDRRAIYRYYEEVLSRGRLDGFDKDRLDKVLALPYEECLKGKAGFYGYIVLKFSHTKKALMECPVYANAIYVLDSSEERLLRMNKQELRKSGEAQVIFHSGDWYQRLKKSLEIE